MEEDEQTVLWLPPFSGCSEKIMEGWMGPFFFSFSFPFSLSLFLLLLLISSHLFFAF